MILLENLQTYGWEPAFRGMRNPLDSWNRADSRYENDYSLIEIGPNDKSLAQRLINAGGNEHCKFRRMISIYVDVIAPLYWWKEMSTYKVGTVANSCSTMHTITKKPFTVDMFSHDHLLDDGKRLLDDTIKLLNKYRNKYNQYMADVKDLNSRGLPEGANSLKKEAKKYWYTIIQSLPTSFNQKRTLMLNYEVMAAIYRQRKNHKLQEWRDFVSYMTENLPESWIFTGEESDRSAE